MPVWQAKRPVRAVTPRPGCGALDLRRASPRPCKSRPLPPLRLGCFCRRQRLGCAAAEFIAGHPNWCHRVMEWQVAVHLQDLNGSGNYIGASAVQGRKVYGVKVSKPQTLYIKRTETATS